MRRGALVAGAIVVVLGGLSWLAWTLLFSAPHGGLPPAGPKAESLAPKTTTAPAPVAAEPPADSTATRAAEAMPPAPPPPPAEAEMPAAYRKALSGVRGRIVEEDGKPVAGLEVELLDLLPSRVLGDYAAVFSGATPKFPELVVAKGRSGDDGTFVLEGTHGSAMHAVGIDLGGARGTLRVIDRSLASGELFDLGDVVLGAFVTFKGKVEDEDGKPIAGARIRATTLPPIVFQPGVADVGRAVGVLPRQSMGVELIEFPESLRAWESRLPLPTTRSGEDGTFELKGVPQGLATLVVDRDGYCGTFKGPTPTGKRDRDVGTIELSRGRDVKGVVVDASGAPVAGVEVFAGVEIAVARMSILFKGSPTGADGRFEIDHLSPLAGQIVVAARASPLQIVTVQPVEDPSRDVTVTLPGACTLGVWLKHVDGTPVDDAGVQLWLNPTPDVPVLVFATPHRVPESRIERLGDGHVAIHGLTAGRCDLFGRVPGLARASIQCTIPSEGPTQGAAEGSEVTLQFAPAATLAVEVVAASDGAPVEWAAVSVSGDSRREAPFISRRTDAKGSVELPELPTVKEEKGGAAQLRVRVAHPAFAPQVQTIPLLNPATPPLRFALTPGAAIHGHVHKGSGPITEPVMVAFEFRDSMREIDDNFPRLAVPGLDGTFELKGLPPATAKWEVLPRLFGGDAAAAMEKVASIEMIRKGAIELAEGKTAELDIDLDPSITDAPAKLTGRVHVRAGRRPERLKLRVYSQQPGKSREMKDQELDVRPELPFSMEIAPGWINVSLMEMPAEGGGEKSSPPRGNQQLYQTWFEIEAGQSREIAPEIEFVMAKVLVVDDSGQPAPHVGVSFNRVQTGLDSESSWLSCQSGDDGVAEVELPRPGTWRCQANSAQTGRGSGEYDFPSARTERVQLKRGVPCSGRIEISNDPGGDEIFHLQFYQVVENGGFYFDGGSSIQLEKGSRTFDIVGLEPGRYRVNLYGNRWSRDLQEVVLSAAGSRDLVLKFRLEDPPPEKDER
jgi:hypothetical protein